MSVQHKCPSSCIRRSSTKSAEKTWLGDQLHTLPQLVRRICGTNRQGRVIESSHHLWTTAHTVAMDYPHRILRVMLADEIARTTYAFLCIRRMSADDEPLRHWPCSWRCATSWSLLVSLDRAPPPTLRSNRPCRLCTCSRSASSRRALRASLEHHLASF